MSNTYRDELQAALARVRELEGKLSARETELRALEESLLADRAVLARLAQLAPSTKTASHASRWPLVAGATLGCAGIVFAVLARSHSAPADAAAASASASSSSSASGPVAPVAPERSGSRARTSIDGKEAIAIPNDGTGWLDVMIADAAISCATRNAPPMNRGSCPTAWQLHLALPPDHRDPGVHEAGSKKPVFAYLDQHRRVKYGGPNAGEACVNDGHDVNGTVEVLSASTTEIVLRLDTDELVGTVKAVVCGSCRSTGMACTTNADCCAQFCGDGRCRP